MASFSLMHWLVVAVVILVLFGRGKISQTMGDFGKGIRSFRKGLAEDDTRIAAPAQITQTTATPAAGVRSVASPSDNQPKTPAA